VATSSSKVTCRAPGSPTSRDIDAVREVGPSEPATQVDRASFAETVSAALRARRAAARLIS
jgi:hypothetical protein